MNDAQDELLDSEFRQILYIIKPYINHITSHYNLECYRVWLERLSSAHPKEKLERNKYLLELANQIHDNVLKPPFTYKPPKGILPPFRNFRQSIQQASPEEISEHFFKEDSTEIQWPYLSPRRSFNEEKHRQKVESPRQEKQKEDLPSTGSMPVPLQKKRKCKQKPRPFQNIGKVEEHRPFQNIGKVEEPKSESSSWCDLTDTTVDGNTDGEKEVIKKQEDKSSNTSNFRIEKFFSDEVKNRKPTEEEVEALKMRMKDLIEVKNALMDTHCLTQDRKRTIENLEKKLEQLQKHNRELETLLEEQKKKFVEVDKIKNKEIAEFKEKFNKVRQHEVDYLKHYHKKEMSNLEKSFRVKIAELEAKIESVKKDHEMILKNVKESDMSVIKQKDSELEQLRNELEMKTSQALKNENNDEQIIRLRRCVSRLDKILRNNEKAFVKRIQKLEEELAIKEMTSQVQLQTQRADIMVRTAAAKQEDVRNAFNSLEAKYKKMMETVQTHALEAKKHDQMIIQELKETLHKHNIEF